MHLHVELNPSTRDVRTFAVVLVPRPPEPWPLFKLVVAHQRGVEPPAHDSLAHANADDHQLLPPVAVRQCEVLLGRIGGPRVLRRRRVEPRRAHHDRHRVARVAPAQRVLVLAREPNQALGSDNAFQSALLEQPLQPVRMERARRAVHEAADPVLLRLRRVADAGKFAEPSRHLRRFLHVEQLCVENLTELDLAVVCAYLLGRRIELRQNCTESAHLALVDARGFVDHDDVGALDLVCQQVDNSSIVSGRRAELGAVARKVCVLPVEQKVECVDDGDEGVEPRHTAEQLRAGGRVIGGEGGGDGHRLRDAGRLNKAVVVLPAFGELAHRLDQVAAQRAADAAVGELHHLLLALLERHLVADQIRVDVELRDDTHRAIEICGGTHGAMIA
eukprot:5281094-Pleurochrysis_carterae.AAC.1